MSDYQRAVGELLERERLRLKLGIRQAGALAGCSGWTVRSWETGRRNMRVEDLARLAAVYGAPVEQFLPGAAGLVGECA